MTEVPGGIASDVSSARQIFEREIGSPVENVLVEQVGPEEFLKFEVGREAPIYLHALAVTQSALMDGDRFKGKLGLKIKAAKRFPESLEASCLLTLLTRSTRAVTEGRHDRGFVVPYVPFQNREDHILSQAASHVVLGRRGVGKSTLIIRANDLLSRTNALTATLDMQTYADHASDSVLRELLVDLIDNLHESVIRRLSADRSMDVERWFSEVSTGLGNPKTSVKGMAPQVKRLLSKITSAIGGSVFIFLDDFHVLRREIQPDVLHFLNGALKGSSSWLKVAGVRSLTNYYASAGRRGLQVPGDAQEISLDLTLENPEAAERHLRAILESFLKAVGHSLSDRVLPDAAFRRLVWANAGVPRDFLQMFARALEHARRNRHSSVTVSDVNIAIGEFGQKKFQEMRDDARDDVENIDVMIHALEKYCLDTNKVNAFLLKSEDSEERNLVRKLSDLRLLHLIHQSITPDSAGEKYEAFIVDYALFTGFRRRPNVREMVPSESQFKASELRKLPKVSRGFLAAHLEDQQSVKTPSAKSNSGSKAGRQQGGKVTTRAIRKRRRR